MLLQEQPEESTRPVGYRSRSLNAAERNYSTTERECLAVVWASLLLRPYTEGTCSTVRTYNAALKWMLHMDGAHGRLARWRLRLVKFDYMVQKRPGASHHAADTIVGSRAHRISAASHCTSAAFLRPSHLRKLRTTGLQMSSYVSPDAWILCKAMSSF